MSRSHNGLYGTAGVGTDGYVGWFQYLGDTYVVESKHSGTVTPSFVNGTDIVVDGGAIGGRRFSEVMAGRQAMRTLFE